MKQVNAQISSPGFMGLNSELSPVSQPPEFAAIADNAVIDRNGRVASRKGFRKIGDTSPVTALQQLHEARYADGTIAYFATDDTNIYRLNEVGEVQATQAHGGAADWQIVTMNDDTVFFQAGEMPWYYDNSASSFSLHSAHTDTSGTAPTGSVGVAAYGRVWAAQGSTLYWSDLLIPAVWDTGSSGSLNLGLLWPVGNDVITAIAAHNDKIIVFGRQSILVFGSSAADGRLGSPATDLFLEDTVANIGCVGRFAWTIVGSDLWFVDLSGMRSLGRTIQEKSLPISDLSRNITSEFRGAVRLEGDNTRIEFYPDEAFVVCLLPNTPQTYIFDVRQLLPDGSSRITTWSNMDFKCVLYLTNGQLWFGNPDSVCRYIGYVDDAASDGTGGTKYRFRYYMHPQTFGVPANLKMPKEVDFTIGGGLGQRAVCYWGFGYSYLFKSQAFNLDSITPDFYNIDEYNITTPTDPTEYGSASTIGVYEIPLNGSGTSVVIGLEVDVVGQKVSLQEINLQTKVGRLT